MCIAHGDVQAAQSSEQSLGTMLGPVSIYWDEKSQRLDWRCHFVEFQVCANPAGQIQA